MPDRTATAVVVDDRVAGFERLVFGFQFLGSRMNVFAIRRRDSARFHCQETVDSDDLARFVGVEDVLFVAAFCLRFDARFGGHRHARPEFASMTGGPRLVFEFAPSACAEVLTSMMLSAERTGEVDVFAFGGPGFRLRWRTRRSCWRLLRLGFARSTGFMTRAEQESAGRWIESPAADVGFVVHIGAVDSNRRGDRRAAAPAFGFAAGVRRGAAFAAEDSDSGPPARIVSPSGSDASESECTTL